MFNCWTSLVDTARVSLRIEKVLRTGLQATEVSLGTTLTLGHCSGDPLL